MKITLTKLSLLSFPLFIVFGIILNLHLMYLGGTIIAFPDSSGFYVLTSANEKIMIDGISWTINIILAAFTLIPGLFFFFAMPYLAIKYIFPFVIKLARKRKNTDNNWQ